MHDTPTLPPKGALLRIGKLNTLAGVREEMVRIYRASRRGELDTQDLTRFAFVLQAIARVIAQTDMEKRVAEIEHRLAAPEGNHESGSPTTTH